MAAGVIPDPGTEHGPCGPREADCSHRDCAAMRRGAACVCPACEKAIGYDRRYYANGGPKDDQPEHAVCLEDRIDREQKARWAKTDAEK